MTRPNCCMKRASDAARSGAFGLRVHPAGLMMLALAVLTGKGREALSACVALLLHEAAHMLAGYCCGISMGQIELTPFGGVASAELDTRATVGQQLWVAGAGVLCSFACFWLPWQWAPQNEALMPFLRYSLDLCLINTLPVLPLDGGRLVYALFSKSRYQKQASKWLACSAVAAGGLLLALAVYCAFQGALNLSLLFVGPYLCYSAYRAYTTQLTRLLVHAMSTRRKLENGRAVRVQAQAVSADAPKQAWLRGMHTGRYQLLVVVDPQTQRARMLDEHELLQTLLGEHDPA